jgi:hypothetical protein
VFTKTPFKPIKLFKNCLTNCIISAVRMVANDELEGMWKDAVSLWLLSVVIHQFVRRD